MSKRSPKKHRRTLPALGLASVSFSMASGACAVIGYANANTPPQQTHEIFLSEEEISDVSLATFHVFDKENSSPLRLARGGGGCGGGGCGHGGGCGGHGGGCGGCGGGGGHGGAARRVSHGWLSHGRLRGWLSCRLRWRLSHRRLSLRRLSRRLPGPLLLRRLRWLRRLRRLRRLQRRHLLDMDTGRLDLQLRS